MITYRCEKDNIETQSSTCPVCGGRTKIIKTNVFWCGKCNVPTFSDTCQCCGSKTKRLTTDIRPVFPEERLLLELILEKPYAYQQTSVWNGAGNKYYVDGKKIDFSVSKLKEIDTDEIRKKYLELVSQNSYDFFDRNIEKFVEANRERYQFIVQESTEYIREHTKDYEAGDMFVSFSGGKDSTVTSDITMRALSNSKLLHIFGDTTLEFPETIEYVKRFKLAHPKTPVTSARNRDKDFMELCELVGPPSRVMRWCCTIFKTGAITRKISTLFRNKNRIVAFHGIRRSESTSRSKYDRESNSPKITKQIVILPIIDWLDFDIWLYLLTTKIDFNYAYRLGYARVGCWCCPNNSGWSEFLSKIYMPKQSTEFRNMLIKFAKSVGKPDAEHYVDGGYWKARQGGNGVAYAQKSVVDFKPCAVEENAVNFELQRPITEELYELFKPFGYLNFEMGNQRLGEVYILNQKGDVVLKLQGRIGKTQLKVTIINPHIAGASNSKAAEDRIKSQITKYQMCMGCMACTSVCRFNAISIKEQEDGTIKYRLMDEKCMRCGECVTHFDAGCYMRKVLAIKRNK